MIPKKAHFYWHDDDIPALRVACIESFKALNPGWIVHVHQAPLEGKGETFRQRVIRSDAARYGVLYRAGGVYFDTDIVFMKPIPENWLESDLILPCTALGEMYGVHVLGCLEGSPFFKQAIDRVRDRMASPIAMDCQALGVNLWQFVPVVQVARDMGLNLMEIVGRTFLKYPWDKIGELWSPGYSKDHTSVGLHWYGGDPLSKEFEDLEPSELPDCPVKQAFEVAGILKCST